MSTVYMLIYSEDGSYENEERMMVYGNNDHEALIDANVYVNLIKPKKWMLQKEVKTILDKNF